MLLIVIETPKGTNGCESMLFEPLSMKISQKL